MSTAASILMHTSRAATRVAAPFARGAVPDVMAGQRAAVANRASATLALALFGSAVALHRVAAQQAPQTIAAPHVIDERVVNEMLDAQQQEADVKIDFQGRVAIGSSS